MGRLPYLVRFFLAAPPTARATVAAFAVTTTVASAIILLAPERAGAALMPVLLLQLFTVSSGFLVPARRGHYDLLLAMGRPRVAVAVVHWIMSAAAGLASCAALVVAEALAGGGAHDSLRTSGTLLAIGVASTAPWAINVRVPRYMGAITWLVAWLIAEAALPLGGPGGTTTWLRAPAVVERAISFVIYPSTLVGRILEGADWIAAVILSGLAAISMAWALATVHRSDIPLEAAQ